MVNKKQSEENANLKNALDDAMNEFGANDDSLVIDKSLIIDESPRSVKKKPLKLRLSVGSLSDFNVENGSTPKFNSFSTPSKSNKDAISSISSSPIKKLPPKLKVCPSRMRSTAKLTMCSYRQDEPSLKCKPLKMAVIF